MQDDHEDSARYKPHLRAAVEIAFIIFLFYSNLLMGEFNRSTGVGKTLRLAFFDMFTITNFTIAMVSAILAHWLFEALRRRL